MKILIIKQRFFELLIFSIFAFKLIVLFSACSQLPSGTPSSNCKFIITGLSSAPNVEECYKTASSTNYIDFDVNLIVWVPTSNPNRKDKLDEKTVSSPSTTINFL